MLVDELRRDLHHAVFRHPRVHGHHLAAHVIFADLTRLVVGVARAHAEAEVSRYDSRSDLPIKEILARVAGPQGSITIESSDSRGKPKNSIEKFLTGQMRLG